MKKNDELLRTMYRSLCLSKNLRIAKLAVLLLIFTTVQMLAKGTSGESIAEKAVLQPQTVTGTVTDENGEPLPGVYVVVQGTTSGTMTGVDGSYSINVTGPDDVLEYSFVGMLDQEMQVGNQTRIDVTMQTAVSELEDIVVVGYGTQTKRNVTGAIQTVAADELTDIPVAQMTQQLQGKVSGVQIFQSSGIPGEGLTIRVRGQGSISAGAEPLYVVDGFPIDGNLNDINSDEIESITVLKDAASTSLYGSRAANGVVMIETKKGQAGRTSIGFSTYFGVQVLGDNAYPQMMNGEEFAAWKKQIAEERGDPVPEAYATPSEYGEGTDWFGLILRPGAVQNYSLSLATGTDRFKTSAVLGFFEQDGVIIRSGYDRISLRMNSEFQATDNLKFGLNVAPTLSNRWQPAASMEGLSHGGNVVGAFLAEYPTLPYENPDGTVTYNTTYKGVTHPNKWYAIHNIRHDTQDLRNLSNVYVELEPIEGLVLRSSGNIQLTTSELEYWQPSTASTSPSFGTTSPLPQDASYQLRNTKVFTWLLENTVSYSKSFGSHNISALAGYTTQKFTNTSRSINASRFPDDRVPDVDNATLLNAEGGRGGIVGTDSGKSEWTLISYIGRFNYDYQGKYLLQAAIRRDGSSRFGPDNRWGNFPSVSAGWIVSDESFFNVPVVSLFKLRGSYGLTGNNNIGNYTHFASVSLADKAVFGSNVVSGASVTNLANTELTWETTAQMDVGFDLSLIQNRINLSYDYYSKSTTNLLYDFNIPVSSGFSTYIGNTGEFKFWGHEINLSTRNLVGELRWNTDFNIAFNDNEVISLAEGVDFFIPTTGSSLGGQGHIVMVGERLGVFWGLVHDGVYVDQADYDSSPKYTGAIVGSAKFKDLNGDDFVNIVSGADGPGGDYAIVGDPTPKFIYGMTNTFAYKNLDFAVTLSGSYGNDIANRQWVALANLDGTFNVIKEVKNQWHSPSDPGDGLFGTSEAATGYERDNFQSAWVTDGSYMTIKNVTLGYRLPVQSVNWLSSVRVYASAQQLLTITKYEGNNPEVNSSQSGQEGEIGVLNLGDDYSSYPIPRTFTFGIDVQF